MIIRRYQCSSRKETFSRRCSIKPPFTAEPDWKPIEQAFSSNDDLDNIIITAQPRLLHTANPEKLKKMKENIETFVCSDPSDLY